MQNPVAKSLFSCLIIVAILVSTSVLGLIAGGFYQFFQDRFLTPWYSLGTPPEPAEKILAAYPFSIVVISSSGNRYSFEPANRWDDKLQGNWFMDDSFEEKKFQGPFCEFDAKYASLPKIAKTIDYASLAWCPEIIVYIQYAIVEDGSVWRWNPNYHPSTFPHPELVGLCMGFIIGLILVARKISMRSHRLKNWKLKNAGNSHEQENP